MNWVTLKLETAIASYEKVSDKLSIPEYVDLLLTGFYVFSPEGYTKDWLISELNNAQKKG